MVEATCYGLVMQGFMLAFMHIYGHILHLEKAIAIGSKLILVILGIWTINMLHTFVKMITKSCTWELERPITLNEQEPKF